MGVENNECVIATTFDMGAIQSVKKWIAELSKEEQSLFAFIPCICNGKMTVVLGPDGSKKGWPTSNKGFELRDKFVAKLISFNYEDGSNPFEWIEVGYGEYGQKVLRGNCVNCYNDDEYYKEQS